jgi:hypothetical protein
MKKPASLVAAILFWLISLAQLANPRQSLEIRRMLSRSAAIAASASRISTLAWSDNWLSLTSLRAAARASRAFRRTSPGSMRQL